MNLCLVSSNSIALLIIIALCTIDDINNFVDVSFDIMTNRFTCMFTNKQDLSGKSCSITLYRDCKQQQVLTAQANSTDSEITLVPNDLQTDSSIYCYVVAASNDTITLNLTGSIGLSKSKLSILTCIKHYTYYVYRWRKSKFKRWSNCWWYSRSSCIHCNCHCIIDSRYTYMHAYTHYNW